jgi:hypothetical protein
MIHAYHATILGIHRLAFGKLARNSQQLPLGEALGAFPFISTQTSEASAQKYQQETQPMDI